MSQSPNTDGYQGQQQVNDGATDFNAYTFLVQQILGGIGTATLVQVKAVTNSGGVSPVGYVDVQPMVAQIDGAGNATPHGVVHDIPYFRLQGGANAVIMDPQVGDIGICVFASRDISSVKANKKPSTPGSRRRFDMADGLYFGAFLGAAPTQYIDFTGGGITILSPTQIKLQAPDIQFVGPTHTTGAVTGDSTAVFTTNVTGGGKSLNSHTHGGVTTGSGTTGGPT